MDTLDRFLLKEFLLYFVFVLIGLAILYLGIDFLSKFWGMNRPMSQALLIYGYKLPAALQLFVPVACLMATLLVLSTMSRQNEILALYSCGVGVLRLLSTFIAVTATLSTFAFLTFDSWVPTSARKEILVQRGLDPSQEELLFFRGQGFWYRSGGLIYNVGRFIPEENRMEDLRIYRLGEDFRMREAVRAKRARFQNNDWLVEDGVATLYPTDSPFPRLSSFSSRTGLIPEKPSDLRTLRMDEKTMRLRDLRRYIERNKSYGFDTTAQQVNYHERLALVFAPLIFVLIAVPFATKPLKTQPLGKSIGFCFLIVFIYLLTFRMTVEAGKGGLVPPIIAGWGPNAIFLFFSGFMMWRH